ncbi:MAG: dTDP-4-dehydrorhamnose reductase family protein [Peptococcaceae bacterium]
MNKQKILVLGSTGMAGHVITTFLTEQEKYEVFNLARKKKLNEKSYLLDASDFTKLDLFLDKENFAVIINCIGILNQFADEFKGRAILLNSYLPHFLADKYQGTGTKIIHLSTDCVFSGKTGSYLETSYKDSDSFYGRTKALGEICNNRNTTIRTSIIGPDLSNSGIGLFNWFMHSQGSVKGFANSIWTGITTIELAKAIEKIIDQDLTGIYHLVPEKSISKYELLVIFKEVFQRDQVCVREYANEFNDKSLMNTRCDFDYKIPDYQFMATEMKEWILHHKSFYAHYDI